MEAKDYIVIALLIIFFAGCIIATLRRKKKPGCTCGCSDCTALCDRKDKAKNKSLK